MASYTSGATFFQSVITKQYNANNLLEDFKPLYLQAGIKAKCVGPSSSPTRRSRRRPSSSTSTSSSTRASCPTSSRDELDAIYGEASIEFAKCPTRRRARTDRDELWNFFIDASAPTCTSSSASRPWGQAQRAHAEVPRAHQRLHRRLVPAVARGGALRRRAPLHGLLRDARRERGGRAQRAHRAHGRCTRWSTTAPRSSSSATAARRT